MKEFWPAEMIKFNGTFLFSELLHCKQNDSFQEFLEFTNLKYFEQKTIMPNLAYL